MKKNEIWYRLFLRILKLDEPTFVRFDLNTGGGGYRFLPEKKFFYKEFYKTESETLDYSLIERIIIPESYVHGSTKFNNDLDKIIRMIAGCNGVSTLFQNQTTGPMQGRIIAICLCN